ncbi:MAG: hypothetical protein UT24_C0016G0020 [Candidatus Woesebacteria bacterium GW2011_GWB1_39_12]|uniref:Uncharacterized protein n=1 Tax=Candidatus Woesebacteria bacterium GW2011_GWB1_39_12 TaxID=1618574 RepID=A0A0G0MIG5_9BACT|nr:MAG: hypothetical protein UT24_C0016G0020 [Candidatus Woesebacteria bacterium GW2011_GWB1_39_12]
MWKYRTCLYSHKRKKQPRYWVITCRCCKEKWIVKSNPVGEIDRHCNNGWGLNQNHKEPYITHEKWISPKTDELGFFFTF